MTPGSLLSLSKNEMCLPYADPILVERGLLDFFTSEVSMEGYVNNKQNSLHILLFFSSGSDINCISCCVLIDTKHFKASWKNSEISSIIFFLYIRQKDHRYYSIDITLAKVNIS